MYLITYKETFTFPPGLLEGANWALSEVMDNVLQHSSSSHSYVMMQPSKIQEETDIHYLW